MLFDLIAAVDANGGLGKNGGLPWRDTAEGAEDMNWFKNKTKGAVVIMGRNTWMGKPLQGRLNIVLSTKYTTMQYSGNYTCGVVRAGSLDAALAVANAVRGNRKCFIIGGATVYSAALKHPMCRKLYLTTMAQSYDCDRFFPMDLLEGATKKQCHDGALNQYYSYDLSNRAEGYYLDLVCELLISPERTNRTNVNTQGVFGRSLRFPLWDNRGPIMPLLTTKCVPYDKIYHELIWFLRGSTDTSYLVKNGVKIWNGNAPDGHVGPIYGYQWRNYGRPYIKLGDDATAHVDQISLVIKELKDNPYSRRHVISAWNPAQLDLMVLPPCHYSFQFYVDNDDARWRLSCLVNMRSTDVALGLPFNIASYATLTHMIAHILGYRPHEVIINMGDCHIYCNHIEGLREQIRREVRRFPTFTFNNNYTDIDQFTWEEAPSYILNDYVPHPMIPMKMSV
jgi:thymidylate synthase/dihydrofolate reductase